MLGCKKQVMEIEKKDDRQWLQISVGAGIVCCICFTFVGLLLGWRLIPGLLGESFGMLAGILSTPFFMEASFLGIGLLTVLGLNIWRRHKAGDDCVEIEVEEPRKDGN